MIGNLKEKILLRINTVTGSLGFFSGYQVCHSICLSVIAFLSIFGITLNFLPFLFLQKYNLLFWSIAFVLLILSLILYLLKPKCISKNAIIFNAGVIVAGIPFKEVESFQIIFWSAGILLIGFTVLQWISQRNKKVEK